MVLDEISAAQQNYDMGMHYPLTQLLENKGLTMELSEQWLREEWGVGVTDDFEILAPHYNSAGVAVSYKTRFPGGGGWYARKGRSLSALYGEWRLRDEQHVWLCEGESDTWLASALLRGRGVALGLPRGAGSNIEGEWLDLLRGRSVTIVFDADAAGRRAAKKWYTSLEGVAREVHISFPDSDLCDTSDPRYTLSAAASLNVVPASTFILERPDEFCYQQQTRSGPGEDINDWVLRPRKYINYLDLNGEPLGTGYEGYFTNDVEHSRLITSMDLKDGRNAVAWSNRQGRAWFSGGLKFVQAVLSELRSHAAFLPRQTAVTLCGLHGMEQGKPVFVLPERAGGTIGPALAQEGYTFYEHGAVVDFGASYSLPVDDRIGDERLKAWAFEIIGNMLRLNAPEAISPIIGWLFAAPLRSLVKEFPTLAVLGGSGSGKTSLVQELLSALFGVSSENNLSRGSTPYGLSQWASGTNALPVWFDEYRNQAMQANLDMVDQLIRDAWTASTSSRGGVGEDKAKVHTSRVTAPIIVSGESMFTERSHIDRTVIVSLPHQEGEHDYREPFQRFTKANDLPGRLGRLYLEWLARGLVHETIIVPESLGNRQAQADQILKWGWSLFTQFCEDYFGITGAGDIVLGAIDEERESASEHVIMEALAEAWDTQATDVEYNANHNLIYLLKDGDAINKSLMGVRTHAFHRWAEAHGYAMPGNSEATKKWIQGKFESRKADRFRIPDVHGFGDEKRLRGLQVMGLFEELNKEEEYDET